ncbi:MAG: transporter substrate-binding domain-containing protein [Acholeplasmatales bacterium]|nr:transporter substrate-binding domain-containing protein [Acholeplasmatales bacterium]
MFKKLFGFVFLFLTLFAVASCSQGKGNKIVVGMECAYEPFNYTEATKTDKNVPIANVPNSYVDGYDVQIAKRIATGLNKELEIRMYAWEGLIQALRANEIDLIIAGMSNTEERRATIDFTDPYYRSEEVVLLRKDSRFYSAKTLEEFAGAKAVGQQGTIYADLVDQMATKGALKQNELDSVPLIVNGILNKTYDVTVVELPVALGICSNNTELGYINLNNLFEVSEEDISVSIGIRKNYEFKDVINSILKDISTEERNRIMNEAINH